jgi:hypothetical protein
VNDEFAILVKKNLPFEERKEEAFTILTKFKIPLEQWKVYIENIQD